MLLRGNVLVYEEVYRNPNQLFWLHRRSARGPSLLTSPAI